MHFIGALLIFFQAFAASDIMSCNLIKRNTASGMWSELPEIISLPTKHANKRDKLGFLYNIDQICFYCLILIALRFILGGI